MLRVNLLHAWLGVTLSVWAAAASHVSIACILPCNADVCVALRSYDLAQHA